MTMEGNETSYSCITKRTKLSQLNFIKSIFMRMLSVNQLNYQIFCDLPAVSRNKAGSDVPRYMQTFHFTYLVISADICSKFL